MLPPSLVRRRQDWALREAVARLSPPEDAARASGSVPLDEARQMLPLTLPDNPTKMLTLTLTVSLTLTPTLAGGGGESRHARRR